MKCWIRLNIFKIYKFVKKFKKRKKLCWMKICSETNFHPTFWFDFLNKGGRKPIQHFIQHRNFPMLDEMLDWFAHFQNLQNFEKEEKNRVG